MNGGDGGSTGRNRRSYRWTSRFVTAKRDSGEIPVHAGRSVRISNAETRDGTVGRGTMYLGGEKGLGIQPSTLWHKYGQKLTVRASSFWTRRRTGWEHPHHQWNREIQSVCHNGLLECPWYLREVWRRMRGWSCLLSARSGQIVGRGSPEVCDEAFRVRTGRVGD